MKTDRAESAIVGTFKFCPAMSVGGANPVATRWSALISRKVGISLWFTHVCISRSIALHNFYFKICVKLVYCIYAFRIGSSVCLKCFVQHILSAICRVFHLKNPLATLLPLSSSPSSSSALLLSPFTSHSTTSTPTKPLWGPFDCEYEHAVTRQEAVNTIKEDISEADSEVVQ